MKTRKLGSSDLYVTELILGTGPSRDDVERL